MDKWYYCHKKRINIAIIGILLVFMLIYIFLTIRTQINKREILYKDFKIGDTFEYQGTNVTIKESKIYRLSEFQKEFRLENFEKPDDQMTDENSIIMVISYDIEKIKQDAKGPDWDNAYIYTVETSQPTDVAIDMIIAGGRKRVRDMDIGEKQSIKVGTYFFNTSFLEKNWSNVDNISFYAYLPDYEDSEFVRRIKIR